MTAHIAVFADRLWCGVGFADQFCVTHERSVSSASAYWRVQRAGRPSRRRLAVLSHLLMPGFVGLQGLRLGLATARFPLAEAICASIAIAGAVTAFVTVLGMAAVRRRGTFRRGLWPSRSLRPRTAGASALAMLMLGIFGGRVLGATLIVSPAQIAGSPGYVTAAGPHGKPFPVGRPWGSACEPMLLSVEAAVPDEVYAQIAAVVAQAREAGLNVDLQDRSFRWNTSALYYPSATAAEVHTVVVAATSAPPPTLRNGQPERINIGWDTRLDPDGKNEDLTHVQGELKLAAIEGDPLAQRRAVRQLIAFTQGVAAAHTSASGLTAGSSVDSFTPSDVKAMQDMSGCRGAAAATVNAANRT